MAFNPKTWYLISKELADIWGELEEETLQLDTTKLVKDYHKGTEEWYRQQIKDTPAFAKKVEELARKHLKAIEEETKNALAKAVEIADKETLKSVEEVAKIKGDITGSKDEFLAASIERFSDFNKGKVSAFVNAAVNRNGVMINNIRTQAENIANTNVRVKSGMWNPTQGLYDLIKKQTEEGIKYGVPVVYSNGRQVSFKAHMEMSVRTKLQNETSERMENATRALGIVFFLASEHADSADDHAPYQGKIYIDENWETAIGTDEVLKEMIRKYIDKNNIKTLQWVKGKPVYFQTRPNCRHYLIPITVMQALGNIDMLKSKLKTKKGDYLERNYSDLKRQRYNERAIRYYKNRYENGVIMYKSTNDPVLKQHILQGLAKDKYLVKKWQHEQRQLILSNKELIRDYDRETVEKLAQDFGARAELRKGGTPPENPPPIVEVQKIGDEELTLLKKSGISDKEYQEYLNLLNTHATSAIKDLYKKYGNDVGSVVYSHGAGEYSRSRNTIYFGYSKGDGHNKYGDLAHEYAHFFDHKASFENLGFKEIEAIQDATAMRGKQYGLFPKVASSSDEFLAAVRADKEHIKKLMTPTIKEQLEKDDNSSGVQDAIDGLFSRSRLKWGHGEAYYNYAYSGLESIEKVSGIKVRDLVRNAYQDLGYDVKTYADTKSMVRNYKAASEIWANLVEAEIIGGKRLEYAKTYLPNSYKKILEIIKGVK